MNEFDSAETHDETIPAGTGSQDDAARIQPIDSGTSRSTDDSLTLIEWARRQAPRLAEVSNSNPNAMLLDHNLVAITDDIEAARVVALDFERTTSTGTDTTMLVLGHPVDREATHEADPEGVTTHAAKRTLLGGIPGAAVFAAILGVGVWFVTGNAAITAGAALGGAIFGFYVAGVWSYVIGTGQSEAYQDGFIDPNAADAIVVALHLDDRTLIDEARRSVSGEDRVRLFEIDRHGELVS
jgi:hypothetical protein